MEELNIKQAELDKWVEGTEVFIEEEQRLDSILVTLPKRVPEVSTNITMRQYYEGLQRMLLEHPSYYREIKIQELEEEIKDLEEME